MEIVTTDLASAEGGPAVELERLPKLDRFFPHCMLGLVEFVARVRWNVGDLKKVWFGNTFEYRPPPSGSLLAPNGIEFAGYFGLPAEVSERAISRLQTRAGIVTEWLPQPTFGELVTAVLQRLRAGSPVLVDCDMSMLQGEERAKGLFQPHMIGIVGWDPRDGGKLQIMDQVKGVVVVPRSLLETSFRRYRERARPVHVLECRRSESFADLPLAREAVLADVRQAVDNLYSEAPHLGLNALHQVARDVAAGVAQTKQAFAIPGLWAISHDRHALKAGLVHWREARVAAPSTLDALERTLQASFGAWFDIDMNIERSLYEHSAERMSGVATALHEVARVEKELAESLRAIAAAVNG